MFWTRYNTMSHLLRQHNTVQEQVADLDAEVTRLQQERQKLEDDHASAQDRVRQLVSCFGGQ